MEESIKELRDTGPHTQGETATQSVMAILAREIQRLSQVTPSSHQQPIDSNERPQKRQRFESQEQPGPLVGMPPLPSTIVLDQIIDSYFSRVHPWIPILQENRFKQRLGDPEERPRLLVVLQAMTVAAIRQVDPLLLCGMTEERLEIIRDWVMTTAMSSLVIESLQALTIIAFNDVRIDSDPFA